jgi:hypothetical protein
MAAAFLGMAVQSCSQRGLGADGAPASTPSGIAPAAPRALGPGAAGTRPSPARPSEPGDIKEPTDPFVAPPDAGAAPQATEL